MAVESPPAYLQASSYGAEITRRSQYALLQRGASIGSVLGGVIGTADMEVTAGTGLHVLVAAGEAIIPGSSSATQSGYYGRVSSSTELSIAAASETLPRIDRVSAIIKDAAYSGSENTFSLAIETGTPTSGANLTNLSGVAAAPASSLTIGYVEVKAKATTPSGVSFVAKRFGFAAGTVGDSQVASGRLLFSTEGAYEAKTFTKAEWEAGVVLNASLPVLVAQKSLATNIIDSVTSLIISPETTFGGGFIVLPGKKVRAVPGGSLTVTCLPL